MLFLLPSEIEFVEAVQATGTSIHEADLLPLLDSLPAADANTVIHCYAHLPMQSESACFTALHQKMLQCLKINWYVPVCTVQAVQGKGPEGPLCPSSYS